MSGNLLSAKIPFLARLPFLVVAIVLGVATVCVAVVRLAEPLPISPWEPAIAMEAVRLNAGMPPYESGHATHMYGPLLTVFLAGIFQMTGLNLPAARVVLSIFAVGLAIFLSTVFCRGKFRGCWLLAFFLFLAINFRTNLISFSAQPDIAAVFFAVVGLYSWITRTSWVRSAFALAFFLCALFLKQTSAAFALIPVAHVLTWERPPRLSKIATSLIPALSVLGALGALHSFWPQTFWAVVTVPASIKVYYERVPALLGYVVVTFPICLIGALALFSKRRPVDQRERWICSSLVVLIPVSVWTMSKSGGSYNSLFFAYLAMTALFVARLDVIAEWLASLPKGRSILAASVIALMVLFSFFFQFERAQTLLSARTGDDKHNQAVAILQIFGPGGISPQDPRIAYQAYGYFGRSLLFELDAHRVNGNWPTELPKSMQEELANAAHVIVVKSSVPTPVLERGLIANRFQPMPVPELEGSVYTLWLKSEH